MRKNASPMSDEPVPVVDLDGTPIRTDMLHETFRAAVIAGIAL